MDKKAWRRRMKELLRDELRGREEKSAAICQAIRNHPAWAAAETVAIFDGMRAEPSLEGLWPAGGRRIFSPARAG